MGRRQAERGSVSPVFMGLLIFALLLMGAFIDREWVNYTMARAESLADFAAEAAAKTGIGWATVHVEKRQWYRDDTLICDKYDDTGLICLESHYEPAYSQRMEYPPDQDYRQADLKQNWQELLGCRRAAAGVRVMEPDWECQNLRIVQQWVEYPETAADVARQVFLLNWVDRPAAHLADLTVAPHGGRPAGSNDREPHRLVEVQVTLSMRSLLGIIPWERNRVPQAGAAITQLEDFTFR